MTHEISLEPVIAYLGGILGASECGDNLIHDRWTEIANLLQEMRLYQFTALHMRPRLAGVLSSEELSGLDNRIQANLTRNILLTRQAVELAREFATADIPLVFLKGAAAIWMKLFRPEERWVSDIDVLIPSGAAEKARSIILDMGYRASDKLVIPDYHHLDPMYHPRHVAGVELHVRPYPYAVNGAAVSKEIFANAVRVDIGDTGMMVPSSTDHAWLLARNDVVFHAAARLKESLEMVLLLRNNAVDFDLLYRREADDSLKHTIDALLLTGNRFFGGTAHLSSGCDMAFMERWLAWSARYEKLLARGTPFMGSRNRYGAAVFFSAPGMVNRLSYIRWVAGQEFHQNHPAIRNPFIQILRKCWRYAKDYLTHVIYAAWDMLLHR